MQEKYGFVYIWYDRKRKMYYIGSHWGTETDGYICSSNRMRDAYRRRPDDFKRRILTRVYTNRSDLMNKEQYWFDRVKCRDRYYNLKWNVMDNSWQDDKNKRLTANEKISRFRKGKPSPHQGKKHSKESLLKISLSQLGRVCSEETKKKMSEANVGKKLSEETKQRMSKSRMGRVISNETKQKMSKSRTGLVFSDESKEKMSLAKKGKKQNTRTCPHCCKVGGASAMGRYHFDNCKSKETF